MVYVMDMERTQVYLPKALKAALNELAAAEDSSLSPDEFAQTSEIVVDSLPQFVLLGLEDEKFRDPYIENSDNIG